MVYTRRRSKLLKDMPRVKKFGIYMLWRQEVAANDEDFCGDVSKVC